VSVFLVYVRADDANKPDVRMENHYYLDDDPPEPVWSAAFPGNCASRV